MAWDTTHVRRCNVAGQRLDQHDRICRRLRCGYARHFRGRSVARDVLLLAGWHRRRALVAARKRPRPTARVGEHQQGDTRRRADNLPVVITAAAILVASVTLLDRDEEFWAPIASRPSTFTFAWSPAGTQAKISGGRVLERAELLVRGRGSDRVPLDAAADHCRLQRWHEERDTSPSAHAPSLMARTSWLSRYARGSCHRCLTQGSVPCAPPHSANARRHASREWLVSAVRLVAGASLRRGRAPTRR